MKREISVVVLLIAGLACGSGNSDSGGGGNAGGGAGGAGGTPGGAQGTPVVLGDNLQRAPDNTLRCVGHPIQINAQFPQPLYNQGHPSCLIVTFLPVQGPGGGVAVSANIRVGASTGPMRFVRMRLLYRNTPQTPVGGGDPVRCCSVEQYGNPFTPPANATTKVPLNFVMTEDEVPPITDMTSVAANDVVGLEILAADVPWPGYWPSNGAMVPNIANYMWFPALSTQGVQAPSNQLAYTAGFSGFVPTFNLDYVVTMPRAAAH